MPIHTTHGVRSQRTPASRQERSSRPIEQGSSRQQEEYEEEEEESEESS